ncbi:MAG: hypothetical protein RMM98_04055 [Acidobacteriota bacterium]|nr:hypothetical protein [Blastocatellia bacterium]MDW8238764.1 hypothetical protein [Acidobacteriota bacterium]
MEIPRKIVLDESNKPIAVQIDIETFAKIEQALEDYALGQLIAEVEADESLDLEAAKAYYEQLPEEE